MLGPWLTELWRFGALIAAGAVLGLATGQVTAFLLLATVVYLVLHLNEIRRLEGWLRGAHDQPPPDAKGLWGEIYRRLYRLQRRGQERERRLRTLLNRFRDSASALPDATIALTTNNEIEWFNDAATRLLGLQSARDAGRDIRNLLRHPEFTEYLAAGNYEDSIDILSPIDDHIHLQVRVVPYGNDERLLIARNVTDLHKLEQIRRDFVANVSHELRTPLTVIAGYLEQMADTTDSDWADSVTAMRQQSMRMQHIVEDLLLLARLESQTPGEPAVVAVPELIGSMIAEARQLSGNQHRFECEVDETLWLLGHKGELDSAFSNILFNAVRYTPTGGAITVAWYADDKGAHFSVTDTGPGIAAHHIDRLTERFYRVDAARSRELGGTGLGLAIVKHVLHRHEATLHVESEVGHGSRFSCDFPKHRITSAKTQAVHG